MDPPVAKTAGPKLKRDTVIGIRVSAEGLDSIDKLAAKEGRNRSDMIRILLRIGIDHRS